MLLAGALVLLACGARSPLEEGGADSTDSAHSSSTGAGAGGAGGEAGGGSGPLACSGLVSAGPPASPQPVLGYSAHRPTLTGMSNGSAALVFAATEGRPDPAENGRILHASVDLFGRWPPALSTPLEAVAVGGFAGGQGFVTSAAFGGDGYDLLFTTGNDVPSPPLDTIRWVRALDPTVVTGPLPESTAITAAGRFQGPRFAATSAIGGSALVAKAKPMGPVEQLLVNRVDAGFNNQVFADSGCGVGPLVGDAIAVPSGDLLYALSSSAGFQQCWDGAPTGLPSRVQVALMPVDFGLEYRFELVRSGRIQQIELAARPGGAWLLFREDTAGGPQIVAQALDELGDVVAAELTVVGNGGATGPFAVSPWADGFVIGWFDTSDPSASTLHARVVDAAGSVVAETAFTPDPWASSERLAVLGSEAHGMFALAWSEVGPASRVRLQRFDCVAVP